MSGQATQTFSLRPTRYADIGASAVVPSVSTTHGTATAAQYTAPTQALASLGSALSGFFDMGAKAAQTVEEVNHRQALVQVERENQALAQQGVIDQKLGKPMNPDTSNRQSYSGAYQTSAADAQAFELGEGLRAELAKQPLDGSVDLQKFTEDFYKGRVGTGSGDRDYDERLLSQFSRSAEKQLAQHSEAQRSTILQNSTAEAIQQFTKRVLSPEGITTPQFAEMRERVGALVRGDAVQRDKIIMSAISGAVQNDGQGVSVLRAMQDLGMDQTQPDYFNHISGEVLKRTNAIKTFDAGQAVQRYQMDMAMERGQYPHGILPPARLAEYTQRWFNIDSIHGVGMGGSGLQQEWARSTQREAGMNLWDVAYRGDLRTQDSTRVASSFGKSPSTVLSEHYDAAMSRTVAGMSPALAASRDGTGLVRPSASDEAAADYANFILSGGPNGGHRAASQDTISDTYKTEMGNPLFGRDPKAMARSFNFYNALANGGVTKDQLHRYFPSEQAENTFWAMRLLSNGGRDIQQIAQDLVDRPYDAKDIEQVARSGRFDLAALARRGGVSGRPEEIDKKIGEARTSSILDSADRKKWFGNATVAVDSNELATFDGLLADQFQLHLRTRGKIDLDAAVKEVSGQTGKFVLVPGFGGTLQAVRDPFKGAGRVMAHPLNEDPSHPLSVSKGYSPIYAPGTRITNAMGDQEDLAVTWAEDASQAGKNFPGKVGDGDKLYLERPGASGLSSVRTETGNRIQFMPGEKVALRTGPSSFFDSKAGLVEAAVPSDPQAAAEFFRQNLGPGWYVQRDGYNGPQGQGYTLYYGGRLKTGEKEREAMTHARAAAVMERRQDPWHGTMTSETSGGAAIRYQNAASGRAARTARSDTTDHGPTYGAIGAKVGDAAKGVATVTKDAARQVGEGAKGLWKGVGGPEWVDNMTGAFR